MILCQEVKITKVKDAAGRSGRSRTALERSLPKYPSEQVILSSAETASTASSFPTVTLAHVTKIDIAVTRRTACFPDLDRDAGVESDWLRAKSSTYFDLEYDIRELYVREYKLWTDEDFITEHTVLTVWIKVPTPCRGL